MMRSGNYKTVVKCEKCGAAAAGEWEEVNQRSAQRFKAKEKCCPRCGGGWRYVYERIIKEK